MGKPRGYHGEWSPSGGALSTHGVPWENIEGTPLIFLGKITRDSIHHDNPSAFLPIVPFFLHPGPVYWDLTLPMFVLQLRNIVYDTP